MNHGSFIKRKELVMKTNLTKKSLVLVTLFVAKGLFGSFISEGAGGSTLAQKEYNHKVTVYNRTDKDVLLIPYLTATSLFSHTKVPGVQPYAGLIKAESKANPIYFQGPDDIINFEYVFDFIPAPGKPLVGKPSINLTEKLLKIVKDNPGKEVIIEIKYDPKKGQKADQTTISAK